MLILILYIIVLLSVAFFTLFERKILGFVQIRKGPDKVFFKGILQPVLDGLKLFLKENSVGFNIMKLVFMSFPFFSLFIMLMIWQSFVYQSYEFLFNSFMFFILFSTMSVYGVIGSGWVSNSKYAMLGSYRGVAQLISYEVCFIFLILSFCFFVKNYSYNFYLNKMVFSHILFYGFSFLFIVWFVVILAELNRSPFDFAESESELVSGFNVEYGGLKFAFLFLSEYGSMIYLSYLTMVLFISSFFLSCVGVMFMMVWVRGVLPRYRYDNLMYLNWKFFLPFVLFFLLYMYLFMVFTL
uniref:NADH-ubiquinone oxidoreductase chain 1 n=1 Tax=Euseius sacchari TaxID=3061191 RepID=A0AAU6PCM8_9ACAR